MKLKYWREYLKIQKTGYYLNCNHTPSNLYQVWNNGYDYDIESNGKWPFRGYSCGLKSCAPEAVDKVTAYKMAMYYRKYGYEKYMLKYIHNKKKISRNKFHKYLVSWNYFGEAKH
jgi:hypothetical protein